MNRIGANMDTLKNCGLGKVTLALNMATFGIYVKNLGAILPNGGEFNDDLLPSHGKKTTKTSPTKTNPTTANL